MATIRQIAQLAKVSPATVSRALANHPHVRPDTRQHILEIAQLYHYNPMRTQQEGAPSKMIKIGCLVPSVSADYYDLVLEGVLEATAGEQFHVMIVQTHHVFAHTCAAIMRMVEQQVDGIFIICGHAELLPKTTLMALWSHNIIPLSIDDTRLPIDSVLTDEQMLG
ncbi:MAG TPA: LacI family DNA-binding transcriptional regulator, partial [Armatimonadota bacterium]